jgi:hypothetical protein
MTNVPVESDDLALLDHYTTETKQRLAEQAYGLWSMLGDEGQAAACSSVA